MSAGEATYLVELESLNEAKAASGYPGGTWDPLVAVYAKKVTASGRERFAANQTTSPTSITWEFEYLESMDPDRLNVPKLRRLVYLGRMYDITAAALVGWHRKIRVETLSGGTVR